MGLLDVCSGGDIYEIERTESEWSGDLTGLVDMQDPPRTIGKQCFLILGIFQITPVDNKDIIQTN